jgi:hypothetical protein
MNDPFNIIPISNNPRKSQNMLFPQMFKKSEKHLRLSISRTNDLPIPESILNQIKQEKN